MSARLHYPRNGIVRADTFGAARSAPLALTSPGGLLWGMAFVGGGTLFAPTTQGLPAKFFGNAERRVGAAGPCGYFPGTTADYMEVENSATDFTFQYPLPLTCVALVEKFGNGSARSTIFTNDGTNGGYSGFHCATHTTGQLFATLGDGSGTFSTDRKSWLSNAVVPDDEICHLIWSVDSFTSARLYINGNLDGSTGVSGSASTLGYNSGAPAFIGGGNISVTDGFLGNIYMVGLYNRSIYDDEARFLANNPFSGIADGYKLH